MRRVQQVALEHDIGDEAGERDVVGSEGPEDGLEVVDALGEGGIGEGFFEAGGVQAHFYGVRGGGGKTEAAGGIGGGGFRAEG